jgi:hypothetical protein
VCNNARLPTSTVFVTGFGYCWCKTESSGYSNGIYLYTAILRCSSIERKQLATNPTHTRVYIPYPTSTLPTRLRTPSGKLLW